MWLKILWVRSKYVEQFWWQFILTLMTMMFSVLLERIERQSVLIWSAWRLLSTVNVTTMTVTIVVRILIFACRWIEESRPRTRVLSIIWMMSELIVVVNEIEFIVVMIRIRRRRLRRKRIVFVGVGFGRFL